MFGWIVRIVMALAGIITGWFVAREAANFGLFQMVVAILLVVFFVAAAAFWPSLAGLFRNRRKPEDRANP